MGQYHPPKKETEKDEITRRLNTPAEDFSKRLHDLNGRVAQDFADSNRYLISVHTDKTPRKVKMKKKEKLNLKGVNDRLHLCESHFSTEVNDLKDGQRNAQAAVAALLDRSKKHDTLSPRIDEIEKFVNDPAVKKNVAEIQEIAHDMIAFNDRLQSMQADLLTQEQIANRDQTIAEKQTELKKMFKQTRRAHGDAFSRIAALESELKSAKSAVDAEIAMLNEKIEYFGKHHRALADDVNSHPVLFLSKLVRIGYEHRLTVLVSAGLIYMAVRSYFHG